MSNYYQLPHRVRHSIYRLTSPRSFRRHQAERLSIEGRFHCFDQASAIYIHIAKCGGTSIAKTLFNVEKVSHRTVRDYQKIFSPEDFNRYYKFTFVRNPWSRMLSAYSFLMGGGGTEQDIKFTERYLRPYKDFADFVHCGVNEKVLAKHWFKPQRDYICLPKQDTPLVDKIYRLESATDDILHACEKLQLVPRALPVLNTSKHDHYLNIYDNSSAAIVAQIYARDIELLNYQFY